ncbi:uncharacterized protein [Dermacentor albipictus]|uniref:uncharacterized protein n=1 Tax=Dermacentor albipictus TaxID=60249 RepID=UPI0031FD4560
MYPASIDSGKTLELKVYFICSADSPARAAMQHFIQFNCYYGCSWCYHPGEYIDGTVKYTVSQLFQDRTHKEAPSDCQHEILTWLAAFRIVQRQHGKLLVAIESKLNTQTTYADTNVVSEPFNELEDFTQFDGSLSRPTKEALVGAAHQQRRQK